jgi:GxxExxY protein
MTDAEPSHAIIGAAIEFHLSLGPGLLESACGECLARELTLRNIPFARQKPTRVVYNDLKLECGNRLDLLVAGRVIVESQAIGMYRPHSTKL